ncbi:MAG: carboxypeptidase regulatory-like domain-containing protein [Candidatus Rokubacteria bacterium]|nr:carboxypeptidase regulatory-like domain-containing protein [Candidatus Rokubacteria bacterium]
MLRTRALAGVAALLAFTVATPVEATHEVDHRYVVLGHVRDATARPLAQPVVRVVREKTGLAYEARTDDDGFYLVIVHLHDEDVLEGLRVAVGRASLRVEARFNPLDQRTPRGTTVDFINGVARERPEEFPAALERYVNK